MCSELLLAHGVNLFVLESCSNTGIGDEIFEYFEVPSWITSVTGKTKCIYSRCFACFKIPKITNRSHFKILYHWFQELISPDRIGAIFYSVSSFSLQVDILKSATWYKTSTGNKLIVNPRTERS